MSSTNWYRASPPSAASRVKKYEHRSAELGFAVADIVSVVLELQQVRADTRADIGMQDAALPVVEKVGAEADLPERVAVFALEIRIGQADAEAHTDARVDLELDLSFEVRRGLKRVVAGQEGPNRATDRDRPFGRLSRLRGRERWNGETSG